MDTIQSEQLGSSEFLSEQLLSARQQRLIDMIGKLRRESSLIRGRGRSALLDQIALTMLESAQVHAEELQMQEQQLPTIDDLPLPPVPDDISTISQPHSANQS